MDNEDVNQVKVKVYLDDGRVFEYFVTDAQKGREHACAIVEGGYRSCQNKGELEHYPPRRILKVKLEGKSVTTSYPDQISGT